MAIYTLKPWEWLENKDGFCGTLKAKTFGMFYQDPKSRNERIRSAKLNMFFGAQWNLLDALSKRFTDATVPSSLGEEEDNTKDTQDTTDTKDTDNAKDGQKTEDGQKENNYKQGDAGTEPGGNTGGPSGQTLTLNVNVNVPSTSATPADTREASQDRTNPAQDKPPDSNDNNDNNTDNNNPNYGATPAEAETATETTETTADTGNAAYNGDTTDTAATDNNTNKTSTNTAATDNTTKAAAGAADTTGSTSGKDKKEKEKGDLIEWEAHKTIFTIFGIMVIVEFGFWMAISGNAQDVFFFSDEADGEGLEFGELFPLLWSVFAGYYGMVEYIMIYFFAPLKTTTLQNNKQYSQYFKWAAYIMLFACTMSTFTFLLSIATFG